MKNDTPNALSCNDLDSVAFAFIRMVKLARDFKAKLFLLERLQALQYVTRTKNNRNQSRSEVTVQNVYLTPHEGAIFVPQVVPCLDWMEYFSKVSSLVVFYGQFSSTLTFENLVCGHFYVSTGRNSGKVSLLPDLLW